MKNPFRRKHRPTTLIHGFDSALAVSGTHTIKHEVRYLPRPRPSVIQARVRSLDGREWILPPVYCQGQAMGSLEVPLAFVTGDDALAKYQCRVELLFDYREDR